MKVKCHFQLFHQPTTFCLLLSAALLWLIHCPAHTLRVMKARQGWWSPQSHAQYSFIFLFCHTLQSQHHLLRKVVHQLCMEGYLWATLQNTDELIFPAVWPQGVCAICATHYRTAKPFPNFRFPRRQMPFVFVRSLCDELFRYRQKQSLWPLCIIVSVKQFCLFNLSHAGPSKYPCANKK